MHQNCIRCLHLQADKMLIKHQIADGMARDIMKRFTLFIDERKHKGLLAPEAACELHRMIKKATGTDDLYKAEKEHYNNLLMGFESYIRDVIQHSDDPFQTALRYALAGNIIDFGPPRPFDVTKTLSAAVDRIPAIDHTNQLKEALEKASTVLYLGDNSGEIVLDKLFIETINHPNLYFATRGGKVINDITLEDAEMVGITKVAKVISNGYDAPSTLLDYCSPEFRNLFNQADVIISKGQGNLEGLIHNRSKDIFFLLMVKCSVIGDMIGVEEKNSVVYYNQKHSR